MPREDESSAWISLMGVGFEFLAAVLLPGGIGWWLDRMLGISPWLMLVGGVLGFIVGLRLLIKSANSAMRKK